MFRRLWIYAFFIGTAVATAYPNIITLFALQVSADRQGWIMGVSGSMMALSFGLATLVSGAVGIFSVSFPLWMAAIGLLICAFLLMIGKFRELDAQQV